MKQRREARPGAGAKAELRVGVGGGRGVAETPKVGWRGRRLNAVQPPFATIVAAPLPRLTYPAGKDTMQADTEP